MSDELEGIDVSQIEGKPWQISGTAAELEWVTPDADRRIGYIARVSNSSAKIDDPSARLIGYLIRKHHWSPFQMANLCVKVTTTRDISAQILRHASVSFQEMSTRYADVEELIGWKECRFEDPKNRQNSWTFEDMMDRQETLAPVIVKYAGPDADEHTQDETFDCEQTMSYWDALVYEAKVRGMEGYQEARRRGVAKEVARAILPFGLVPTTIYMNAPIRSWMFYINERTKVGVQKEHRDVAIACEAIFAEQLPDTYYAFKAWQRTEAIKDILYNMFGQNEIGLPGDTDDGAQLVSVIEHELKEQGL